MQDDLSREAGKPDITKLSDVALYQLYCSKEPDDPDVDRIANEMEARGIDF